MSSSSSSNTKSNIASSYSQETTETQRQRQPQTIGEYDHRENTAWVYSFGATMVPFVAFCYGHRRGVTVKVVDAILRSRIGGVGLLALPFCTLAIEKGVYDTVQAYQGIDPNVRPSDRGGFPSGGASLLPSFSLIAVRRPTQRSGRI